MSIHDTSKIRRTHSCGTTPSGKRARRPGRSAKRSVSPATWTGPAAPGSPAMFTVGEP
jgi:hypothetical protein